MTVQLDDDDEVYEVQVFFQPPRKGRGKPKRVPAIFQWELCSATLVKDNSLSPEEKDELLTEEFVEKLHDWDVEDRHGERIPCTEDNVRKALNKLWFQDQILKQWLMHSSQMESKKKSARVR
jgi:hypothetical protein